MWVLAMISLYLKKVGRELSPTRRAKCNKRKRPQKRATSFLCMYLVSILKKTTRYCITMYYLWVVVRDYGACISSMTHQHGQYACWMSTGRKNGLMLKLTHETQTRTSLFRYIVYIFTFIHVYVMSAILCRKWSVTQCIHRPWVYARADMSTKLFAFWSGPQSQIQQVQRAQNIANETITRIPGTYWKVWRTKIPTTVVCCRKRRSGYNIAILYTKV